MSVENVYFGEDFEEPFDGDRSEEFSEQVAVRNIVLHALHMHEQANWGIGGIVTDEERAEKMRAAEEAMEAYREEAEDPLVAEVDGMPVTLDDYCEDRMILFDDERVGEYVDQGTQFTDLERSLKKYRDQQSRVVKESQRLNGIRVDKDDDPDVDAQPLGC